MIAAKNIDHSIEENKAVSKKNTIILKNKGLLPFEKNQPTVSPQIMLEKNDNLKRRHLIFSPKKTTSLEISSSAPVVVQKARWA